MHTWHSMPKPRNESAFVLKNLRFHIEKEGKRRRGEDKERGREEEGKGDVEKMKTRKRPMRTR